jgi:histidyl-tRNA synthetase
VTKELLAAGCDDKQAQQCLALAGISATDGSFVDAVRALGVTHAELDEGLDELLRVVEAAAEHAPGLCVVDLSVARGLDYYTGTVYETTLIGHESIGSICSGGRYDSLASDGTTTFPGVGLSLGITRLLGRMFGQGLLRSSRSVPTCVLVALPDEESRAECRRVAAALRGRGIPTEVAPEPAKYGKQIRFAERRGIPFVWFPQGDGTHEVKDIRSGDQQSADLETWSPPPADLHPTVECDEIRLSEGPK